MGIDIWPKMRVFACCLNILRPPRSYNAIKYWGFIDVVFVCVLELSNTQTCNHSSPISRQDLSDPEFPPIFHDLTMKEIKGLQDYLYIQPDLNLVSLGRLNRVNSSYVFTIDLYPPDKVDVLRYYSRLFPTPKPPRAALVTIFRGDLLKPMVEEYVVLPLPRPNQHRLLRTIPFEYRPLSGPEFNGITDMLARLCDRTLRRVLEESFGGRTINCGDRCLVFRFTSPLGSGVTKTHGSRKIWFWMHQFREYFSLHPVDFGLLVDIRGSQYNIERVWYNNLMFDSLHALAIHYRKQVFPKLRVPFPRENKLLFSKQERRGHIFPEIPINPPRLVEPDGRRYSVLGNAVKYMNWEFSFRLSPVHGPQLYDIRYLQKRIVYELGVQDIVVFYSGAEPGHVYANFYDSFVLIGLNQIGLVPGVDCPTSATFINKYAVVDGSMKPLKLTNSFCIFEQSTGEPLRRHYSKQNFYGKFYEGAPSNVLILRTITTISNYDYIIDFIFHQNGVLQVKVVPTGYILPSLFTKQNDDKYGFRINDKLVGNLHHHTFHFKVDIDINGQSNRYQTLDIEENQVRQPFSSAPNDVWFQTRIRKTLKRTELDSLYKFDFEKPKYHIFYNDKFRSKQGNPMAYRLVNKGMSKSLIPVGAGNEPSGSWMRYQMAVTKRKESERHSSSMFAIFDSERPVADFRSYFSDDENIVDEDLVAWVTMGTHHIPHSEDLPVTHTPGLDLSFFLSPFNYFPEDPGMGSRDSVRIEPLDRNMIPRRVLKIDKQTFPEKMACVPPRGNYYDYIRTHPNIMFP